MTTTTTPETIQIYRVHQASPRPSRPGSPSTNGRCSTAMPPSWTTSCGQGGAFRAYANEGMKALGCPDVISDGQVIESDPPRRLIQTWRMTMTPVRAAGRPRRPARTRAPRW